MILCLDACVLYPTVLRELLLGAAGDGLYSPIWSERILEEWRRTAARRAPDDAAVAEGEIALLGVRWPNARVPADPDLEQRLWLPDPHDIHVLATAITGGAEGIVTLNLRDFPARELQPHGLQLHHPDALLYRLWLDHPDQIDAIAKRVHATAEALSGESIPLRALLKRARLSRLGKALSSSW